MAAGAGQLISGQLEKPKENDADGFVIVGHRKLAPLFNWKDTVPLPAVVTCAPRPPVQFPTLTQR
jgi:hypothetical protein